jgi:hypothetical protein
MEENTIYASSCATDVILAHGDPSSAFTPQLPPSIKELVLCNHSLLLSTSIIEIHVTGNDAHGTVRARISERRTDDLQLPCPKVLVLQRFQVRSGDSQFAASMCHGRHQNGTIHPRRKHVQSQRPDRELDVQHHDHSIDQLGPAQGGADGVAQQVPFPGPRTLTQPTEKLGRDLLQANHVSRLSVKNIQQSLRAKVLHVT